MCIRDSIKGLDRMGEKSAENIITGIAQSKAVPFERVKMCIRDSTSVTRRSYTQKYMM